MMEVKSFSPLVDDRGEELFSFDDGGEDPSSMLEESNMKRFHIGRRNRRKLFFPLRSEMFADV